MLKPFDQTHAYKTDITEDNCEELTGYDFEKLMALTGIFGLPEFKTLDSIPDKDIFGRYPEIEIKVITDLISFKRIINLEDRSISNEYIRIVNTREGKGLSMICSQIEKAKVAGLNEITCTALGNFKMINEFNGYITWGRLGFTMQEYELDRYHERLDEGGIPRMSLEHVLLNHFDFWRKSGSTWDGLFSVDKSSENRRIMKRYILNKIHTINTTIEFLTLEKENISLYSRRGKQIAFEVESLLKSFYYYFDEIEKMESME